MPKQWVLINLSEKDLFSCIHLHFELLMQLSFKLAAGMRELLSTIIANLLFAFLQFFYFYFRVLYSLNVIVQELGLLKSHHFAKSIHCGLTTNRNDSKEMVNFRANNDWVWHYHRTVSIKLTK